MAWYPEQWPQTAWERDLTLMEAVAILHDYDSRWAIEFQRHSRDFDPIAVLLDDYRPLRDAVQSVDIVSPTEPLDSYRLVLAPWLNVLPEELARHLLDYVRAGGHLVLGPRSGMKDEWNALHRQRQPGPLAGPLGGRVEQFYALLDAVPVSGAWGSGRCRCGPSSCPRGRPTQTS
jgi:beta-galactosidase